MKYPFHPIDTHRNGTELDVIADRIGTPTATLRQWRIRGLNHQQADACATALGLHAYILWPEMLAVDTAPIMRECAAASCYETFVLTRSDKRFCSDRCRRSMRDKTKAAARARERYWADPDHRAAKIESQRAYAEAARPVLAAKQRNYYWRDPELRRAAKRAAYAAKKAA